MAIGGLGMPSGSPSPRSAEPPTRASWLFGSATSWLSSLPGRHSLPHATPAVNKYAHFQQPEAELDFHDRGILDGSTVKRMTEAFVEECRKKGLRRVRIITGKGKGSQGAPLVGPQVRRTLEALRRADIVTTFGDAKVTEGGHGAVDVMLTPS